jgi:hypothetical protein
MNTSSMLKFDRYGLFTPQMMNDHSCLINDVELFNAESSEPMSGDLVNCLYGIWDGCIYNDMLTLAEAYPEHIYTRVHKIYHTIWDYMEEDVDVDHCIQNEVYRTVRDEQIGLN